jgi:hypothetical protein
MINARPHTDIIRSLQLTTLDNLDRCARLTRVRSKRFNALNQLHVLNNTSKDDVGSIEPVSHDGGDEKLRAVTNEYISIIREDLRKNHPTTYVPGPALAIERRPGISCFSWKFSSGNVSP